MNYLLYDQLPFFFFFRKFHLKFVMHFIPSNVLSQFSSLEVFIPRYRMVSKVPSFNTNHGILELLSCCFFITLEMQRIEQWKKGPWLFRVFWGSKTIQLFWDYMKPLQGSLSNNQDSMESKRVFFRGSIELLLSIKRTGPSKGKSGQARGCLLVFLGYGLLQGPCEEKSEVFLLVYVRFFGFYVGNKKQLTRFTNQKSWEKRAYIEIHPGIPDLIANHHFLILFVRPYEEFVPGPEKVCVDPEAALECGKFLRVGKRRIFSDCPKGPAEKKDMWKSLSKCRICCCSKQTTSLGVRV